MIAGSTALALPNAAQAACSPAADNTPNPPPGTTVTCAGTTTDQNGTDGYGTGVQAGITINVNSGATLTGSASNGMNVGSATVNNSGSILGALNGVFSQNDVTTTNNVGASITGTALAGIVSNNGNVTVVNSGTIAGNANNGIFAFLSATVTNNAGASITGDVAIQSGFSGVANVTNSGNVVGTNYGVLANGDATVSNNAGGVISGSLAAIGADQKLTLTNAGTISSAAGYAVQLTGDADINNAATGTITGAADAIRTFTGSLTVRNLGSVTGGSGFAINANTNATVFNGAGASLTRGISANLGFANVTNYGNITNGISAGTDATVTNGAGGHISSANFAVIANGGVANVINSGVITGTGFGTAILGSASAVVTNNAGGQISGGDTGIDSDHFVSVTNYGVIAGGIGRGIRAQTGGSSVFNAGTISGATAILFSGTGNVLTLAPGSVITGNVIGGGSDTFQLGGSGAASFDVSALGAAAQYQGFSIFNKVDSSVWTLTGTSTYAGDIRIGGGTLSVNGNVASASHVVVDTGGTLGGNGIVGNTIVNGGALAPGNSIGTLTVQGSLVFTTASTYMVEVSSSASDRTNVTGSATLAGTVRVVLSNNTYRFNSPYTILTAGTLNGRFDSLVTPVGISGSLIYSGAVQLNLNSGLSQIGGLNINQRAVATALDRVFNSSGTVTGALGSIFAGNIPSNLTQASGELATASQQTTFDAMNLFVNLLAGPFAAGRDATAPTATSFAAEAVDSYAVRVRSRSGAERDAYAMITKAPVMVGFGFDQRWSVWGAGYGGSQTAEGNAIQGSNTTTSRIAGTAVGAEYRISPFTQAGFALAGGGTSFVVASGLGSGRSDLFQAGAFVRHVSGAAYLSGALAYGWQDITTDRTVTIAGNDRLRAEFNANAWAGRLEAGYRFVTPWLGMGFTPYSAAQVTTFELPNYAEQAVVGANNFALNYSARSVASPRSELGFRTDRSFLWSNAILTLRSRFGWAHDYNTDRSIAATFQTLPAASFVVGGASPGPDAAIASVGAEAKWRNGFSLGATFEGEFSNVSSSYAGKAVARYAW